VPDQLPVVAVRVWPCCGVPVIVGGAVFTGGAAVTVAEAFDTADVDPQPERHVFDTVTRARTFVPISPAPKE
jgi:hypothetical protein